MVCYFTPNVTMWKQPRDFGVIAAVKKEFKAIGGGRPKKNFSKN